MSEGGQHVSGAGAAGAALTGGYARREVAIDPARVAEGSLELSLAPAFGPLFAALFAPLAFHVRKLALDFVAPERLGPTATYSARVGAPLPGGGAFELSLVIARGAFLCACGEAVIELASPAPRSAPAGNGLNGRGLHASFEDQQKGKHG